jgi:DNA-binding transcriptional LysR family regulator
MKPRFDWNDLQVFLAVIEAGTTLAAARRLRLSQTTVARRVAAMEAALELGLFEKRPQGYLPTEAALALVPAAEAARAAMAKFTGAAQAGQRALSGSVRLATNVTFANHVIEPAVVAFRAAYPEIDVEILAEDRMVDIAAGEADIALRAGRPPTEAELFGRRLAQDTWSIYCSRAYAEAHGIPAGVADLVGHRCIGLTATVPVTPLSEWVRANMPARAVVVRRDSVETVLASIRNGTGICLMSDFLGASDAGLVKCFSPDIDLKSEVWLLTHEKLRQVPRVKALFDFLSDWFRRRRVAVNDA